MKKIFLAILVAFSCFASAQKNTYKLYFKKNQVILSTEQKKELSELAKKTKEAELVTIFPLTYDSIYQRYIFSNVADKQAAEIAKYTGNIGFEVMSRPSNFPSGFKGRSFSINVKLIRSIAVVEVQKPYFAPKPSQFFLIDPKRDTLIKGNEGTKLHFPIGCMQTKNKVMVELKEYYAMADYVKYGLPSISNGKMIESGGVIYLNAKENIGSKKQVSINPDKGVGLEFTLGKNKPNMQVFVKDPSSKKMNWILQDSLKGSYTWEMTETIVDPDDNVISQKTYHSKEEWEKHLALEEKKEILQKKAEKTKAKSDDMLQLYNLGFINCDRFPNQPLKPLKVYLTENSAANYYLVFNDIRGVMSGTASENILSFESVPVNRQATLIAIAFEGSQAYYFSSPLVTGGKPSLKINLKPVDEKFINGELAKLH